MKRLLLLLMVSAVGVGCDARFKNLDPDFVPLVSDGGVGGTGGSAASGGTAGAAGGSGGSAGAGTEVVLATGTWEGRTGYSAAGSVSLVEQGGSRRLEFADDFAVAGVPGPYVVVSTRDTIGSGVNEGLGDRLLEPLGENSGAQTYEVPGDVGDIDYVWVYCQPFTVEVARAQLVPVP